METASMLASSGPGPAIESLAQSGMGSSQLVMLILAVGMLTLLLISTYRRTRSHRQTPRSAVREIYDRSKAQAGTVVKREVEDIMLELDQLARQIQGRIDTRFAKLEAVIRDADERIDQLSRLVRQAKAEPSIDITLEAEDPQEEARPAADVNTQKHQTIYGLADTGMSVPDIAQQVGQHAGEVELVLALRKAQRVEAAAAQATTAQRG